MMLAYLKLKEKRRFRRVGIHRDVVLSTAGEERFKVKLIDISRGGIKFLYYRDRIRIEQGIRLNNRYFEVMLLSKDLDHRIIRIMFRNVMTRAQFRDLVEQLRKA
ncbi:MAG: PilZ domain-containing protein, partial [bacterium]|nr:PilZ domain-containing protein [bacterium]